MSRTERGSAIVEVAVLGSLVFGVLIHVLVVSTGHNHGLADGALQASVVGLRRRGSVLLVRVRTEVPVATIPFLGAVAPGLTVPVVATHAVRIDRYRSGS